MNYTGVMPIIFAQPLLQIPAMLLKKIPSESTGLLGALRTFGDKLGDMGGSLHLTIYAVVIMLYCLNWRKGLPTKRETRV